MKPGLFTTIYMNEMASLGLFGVDMLVYRALCFECRAGAAKIVMKQFAQRWRIGDYMTAKRHIDKLIRRGIISENDGLISVVKYAQIEHDDAQIEYENAQNEHKNAQIEQRLNNKINNINNNSSSLADLAATPPQLSSLSSFIPPSENEVLAYANQKKIPEMVARKFHQYYQGNGWYLRKGQKMKVWESVLDYWWSTEQKDQQTRAVTMIQAGGRGQIIQTDRDREIEEIVRKQREADKARRAQEEASLTDEDILANQQIGLNRKLKIKN